MKEQEFDRRAALALLQVLEMEFMVKGYQTMLSTSEGYKAYQNEELTVFYDTKEEEIEIKETLNEVLPAQAHKYIEDPKQTNLTKWISVNIEH